MNEEYAQVMEALNGAGLGGQDETHVPNLTSDPKVVVNAVVQHYLGLRDSLYSIQRGGLEERGEYSGARLHKKGHPAITIHATRVGDGTRVSVIDLERKIVTLKA